MELLSGSLIELITQTSTNLPPDVRAAMSLAAGSETPGTQSSQALGIILSNIDMAKDDEGPICQDTGMPTFVVHTPVGVNQMEIKRAIRAAIAEATRLGKLRPNSVDSLTGKNSGDNLGAETPVMHFDQWERDDIEVKLILKGGGCENKNIQYSLPCELDHLGRADRNLEGVRKCILHAVWQAQGQGCAPGALGVCIGSDRAHGYDLAKGQLFRTLDDENPNPLQDHRGESPAREFLRFGGLRMLGLSPPGRAPRCGDRRDYRLALSRSFAARGAHGARLRLQIDGTRGSPDRAADRSASARAESRRRGPHQRRN